jgi:hypothetical protein
MDVHLRSQYWHLGQTTFFLFSCYATSTADSAFLGWDVTVIATTYQ